MKKLSIIEEYNNSIEQNLLQAGFVISKKYAYSNSKSGSWNISKINSIFVDDKNQNVAFVQVFFSGVFESKKNLMSKVKVCSYKDINDFELKEDGQTIISGKSGSALVGGALFGGVGAVIGASGKRTATNKCTSSELTIYINDLNEPVLTFNIFDSTYVLLKAQKDNVVREIIGLLTYIKNQPENPETTPFDMHSYTENLNAQVTSTQSNNPVLKKTSVNAFTSNERDKWVTFIFCLILGGIGLHKFYEKKIGMGILYLFTFGLFGIGIIVDLITILLKKERFYTVD